MRISRQSLLSSLTIIAISFFTFYPSFKLALFGDDWLAFFRYVQHLGPRSSGEWNHSTYYLTPYGPQDMIMGLLYKVYGYNSTLYYITSYVLRLIAAFSLYPLVYYLTKSKLSGFFAALFFSVTAVGLDTTNWVFNMPTYITISLFFIAIYFFISEREIKSKKRLLISALLYYLAYITTPIRMHGSLIFLFLLESFWFFQKRDAKTLKRASLRFGMMFLVFLIVKFGGHSLGPPEEIGERLNLGITATRSLLGQGRFDFLFYPIVMVGGMIIPDLLLNGVYVNSFKQILNSLLFSNFSILVFVFLILKIINKFTSKIYLKLLSLLLIWDMVVIFVSRANLPYFANSILTNLLLVGGYTMLVSIFLLYSYRKQTFLTTLLFLSTSWMVLSFFFAWWWVPTSLFPTTYRYLIVSAAGTATLFSAYLALGKTKSEKIRLLLLFLPLILVNIVGTQTYLNQSLINHNQQTSHKIWSTIPHIDDLTKSSEPRIFYFEAEEGNAPILHDVITFGFPPHMALIYNLKDGDPIPVPMSDFKEVVAAVSDGKPMPAYGYKVKPVDIDHIYAFHLQGRDNLINITDEVREKLRKLVEENTQN